MRNPFLRSKLYFYLSGNELWLIPFTLNSSTEVKGFPYGFSGDYERLESQFCSQIREEFTSCGFYKQKQVNYDDTLMIVNGVKLYKNNWSDFDCEATCGLGAKPPFNSGWFALIALLVVFVILVCMCRGCLNLCSKCCPATREESKYGPGRSTLIAYDSPWRSGPDHISMLLTNKCKQ